MLCLEAAKDREAYGVPKRKETIICFECMLGVKPRFRLFEMIIGQSGTERVIHGMLNKSYFGKRCLHIYFTSTKNHIWNIFISKGKLMEIQIRCLHDIYMNSTTNYQYFKSNVLVK